MFRGDYKIEQPNETTHKEGWECVPVHARVDDVFEVTGFVATDPRLPASASEIDVAMAIFAGAGNGYGSYHWMWREKSAAIGNLPVEMQASLWLPDMTSPMTFYSRLTGVHCKRVSKNLFEAPSEYQRKRWSFSRSQSETAESPSQEHP